MQNKFYLRTLFIPLFLCLISCAPHSDSQPPVLQPGQGPAPGNLVQRYQRILKHKYASDCDRADSTAKLKMLGHMDDMAEIIGRHVSNQPNSDDSENLQVGPAMFKRDKTPQAPKIGWQLTPLKSWSDFLIEYKSYELKPTLDTLVYLNSGVRGILVDDEDRVLAGRNFYLNRESGPLLKRLLSVAEACEKDSTCWHLDLDNSLQDFIQGNPHLRKGWDWVEKARNIGDLSDAKTELLYWIERDYWVYRFRKNDSIQRISRNEIVVPINPGPFSGHEDLLEGEILKRWRNPDLKVSIKWLNNNEPFRFEFFKLAGERAFTRYESRKAFFASGTYLSSFAHEFGHIMGGPDHYYAIWNGQKCLYVYQDNEEDVMSVSRLGTATPQDWEELDKEYPWEEPKDSSLQSLLNFLLGNTR